MLTATAVKIRLLWFFFVAVNYSKKQKEEPIKDTLRGFNDVKDSWEMLPEDPNHVQLTNIQNVMEKDTMLEIRRIL